jgi:hypothetical protein
MFRLLILFAISAAVLFAADYSGTYKAEVQTSSGKVDNILVLKQEGSSLTGTLTNQRGKFPILNGSVEKEDIFFNVVVKDDGDDFKMTYRGHVFGGEIQFKIEAGERVIEMVAKKVE